ncbi:MAG: pyridoxal phosphate-dependent aminotransferase [Bacteroidales bacterium]|nr:pyridoxal phosphate-dependent aminotransferase [Bacteroidales bacterium]MDD4672651.1 pyridoxal phosphate-dependent aminotransferase [Bacteroidales bacterium]MDY0347986.1 pyridoxal phosphate-dependent aminotransferase [Tenuifilaceae bacterium]
MENVSNRVAQLAVSETLAMSQKSRELQAQGVDVINLSVGEPDFNTPDFVKDAAIKAIENNFTHYSPVPGYADLLQVISDKLKRENGLVYGTDQIVVSGGAKHALTNVLMATINAGDEVIVPAPYWVSYVELVKLAEGKSVVIPTSLESDFKITPQQLAEAITPRTRALMLCSPSNPTGSVYSRSELKALVKVLVKHPNILILSDEIYEHINYEGKHESIAQFSEISDRVIIVNGVSKGYAMTGWRIGYCAAPKWIAKACQKLQGQMTSGTCSIAQKAAVAAIGSDTSFPQMMCKAFRKRRDLAIERLKKIPGFKANVPQGAFYIFAEVSELLGKKFGDQVIASSADLCMYLLNHAHVATVPGSAFGSPEYIRFSYAASEEQLIEALDRIDKAVREMR